VLVTARHVIEGATELEVSLMLRASETEPALGDIETLTIRGGAPQFLVEAAVFSGSSGSPVVILRPTAYGTQRGSAFAQPRVICLGILAQSIMSAAQVERGGGRCADLDVRVSTGLGVVLKWSAVEETIDSLVTKAELDRDALRPSDFMTSLQAAARRDGRRPVRQRRLNLHTCSPAHTTEQSNRSSVVTRRGALDDQGL